jgi:hypothetical protein
MINKKGDITVTVLVIGVVFVCFLALLTFYLNSLKVSGGFTDIGEVNELNMEAELGTGVVQTNPAGRNYISKVIKGRRHWYSLSREKIVLEVVKYLP